MKKIVMFSKISNQFYVTDPFNKNRVKSIEVNVGNLKIGSSNHIVIQSMTTTDTMDTNKSVEQSIRMINAGCELVRLTAPSIHEAENLKNIKNKLNCRGFYTPLVADIHFTPKAAELAAKYLEKVRINPGNFVDKKKFEVLEYTEEQYIDEIEKIKQKLQPLIKICKDNNTALRIGTNHGSLSDRILSKYGDTPIGMVESALEFIRICVNESFYNIIVSMKASNTLVMVYAYRLLLLKMNKEGFNFPLHLGVTEAGDGEDGRIKSAVGIGALLEDGIGDTIRVSLTEDPEFEIPVAKKLLEKTKLNNILIIQSNLFDINYNPYEYEKRFSDNILNIGGKQAPVVFGDLSNIEQITAKNFFSYGHSYSIANDKWTSHDMSADYIFIGDKFIDFELPGTFSVVCFYNNWLKNYSNKKHFVPILNQDEFNVVLPNFIHFLELELNDINNINIQLNNKSILIVSTPYDNKVQILRAFRSYLDKNTINNPVIIKVEYNIDDLERLQLYASADLGGILIDGFGDGIIINSSLPRRYVNSLSFGILQATRTRISKTEYISCPSCGRTQFDLQDTTAKIRQATSHLKGIKIGIMGCIVNGPGEMADADYGYVGTGKGKITLYKEKIVVKRNIDESYAIDELINLIKENGDWVEP